MWFLPSLLSQALWLLGKWLNHDLLSFSSGFLSLVWCISFLLLISDPSCKAKSLSPRVSHWLLQGEYLTFLWLPLTLYLFPLSWWPIYLTCPYIFCINKNVSWDPRTVTFSSSSGLSSSEQSPTRPAVVCFVWCLGLPQSFYAPPAANMCCTLDPETMCGLRLGTQKRSVRVFSLAFSLAGSVSLGKPPHFLKALETLSYSLNSKFRKL